MLKRYNQNYYFLEIDYSVKELGFICKTCVCDNCNFVSLQIKGTFYGRVYNLNGALQTVCLHCQGSVRRGRKAKERALISL